MEHHSCLAILCNAAAALPVAVVGGERAYSIRAHKYKLIHNAFTQMKNMSLTPKIYIPCVVSNIDTRTFSDASS